MCPGTQIDNTFELKKVPANNERTMKSGISQQKKIDGFAHTLCWRAVLLKKSWFSAFDFVKNVIYASDRKFIEVYLRGGLCPALRPSINCGPRYMCARNYQNIAWSDKVTAEITQCSFFWLARYSGQLWYCSGCHCYSCSGREWSTFVRHQWTSVAWYVEAVSPPSECVTYYITEAQRTIDTADADSLIACLSALMILLPKVVGGRSCGFLSSSVFIFLIVPGAS